jgi:hypothetical protein
MSSANPSLSYAIAWPPNGKFDTTAAQPGATND